MSQINDRSSIYPFSVALDEGGEEGENTIYGERDEKRLPTSYPVSQSPPEESPDHHPKIYNQTCRESKRKENITNVDSRCQCCVVKNDFVVFKVFVAEF